MESMFYEIIDKIVEYAIRFFNYTMNVGENKFMLVDFDILNGDDISDEVGIFFIASFVIMSLIAILAADSFNIFHPIQGIKEWKTKIHVVKVTVFAAAVFSLHTFYKMFVTVLANMFHDGLDSVSVNCLGSFINPISVCIMSIAIVTADMRKKYVQAFFLGLSIFVTPALLSYPPFTKEAITIYVVGASLSLVAGIIYKRFSMYVTYAIMSFVYLIGKFFMVANSTQVRLTDGKTVEEQIGQYISCIRIDIGMIIVLMLILFIYRTAAETLTKKKVVSNIIVAALFVAVFVFSYPARLLFPVTPVVYAKEEANFWNLGEDHTEISQEIGGDIPISPELDNTKHYVQEDVQITKTIASSFLKGSSNKFDIDLTIDGREDTCWQDGVEGDGIGETLRYEFDRALICKVVILNGNRRTESSYGENGRLAKAKIYFYDSGELVHTENIDFSDGEMNASEFEFEEAVECDSIAIEVVDVYGGTKWRDTGVSEVGFVKLVEE